MPIRSRLQPRCQDAPFSWRPPLFCLNNFSAAVSINTVRVLRNTLLLLLAAAWLPLTAHCRLEALPGLEFLQCADEQACQHESAPNSGGTCCSFESSEYFLPAHQPAVHPVLVLALPPFESPMELVRGLPASASLGVLTAAPPDLPSAWQFVFRTALPPRAPSFAS